MDSLWFEAFSAHFSGCDRIEVIVVERLRNFPDQLNEREIKYSIETSEQLSQLRNVIIYCFISEFMSLFL